jgi:hypothetical protein
MKCKKTFDARTLSHDALEQLRKSAVKRVAAGESPEFVAAGLGINRRALWLQPAVGRQRARPLSFHGDGRPGNGHGVS